MDDTGPFDGPRHGWMPLAALLAACALVVCPTAEAQSTPVDQALNQEAVPDAGTLDTPIADVQIEGNVTIPSSAILSHIKSRPGRSVSSQMITADTQELLRTRWFITVEPRVAHTDAGPVLIFRVIERPIVRRVEYRGNDEIKTKQLEALTGLKPNSPYDPHTNIEAARRIESFYHDKGYIFAKVTLVKGDKRDDREVIFSIEEGKKVRVKDVKFYGNKDWFNSSGYLKTKLQTERMFPIVPGWLALPFGGLFKPDSIQNDIAALQAYYHGLGFFDVQIEHKVLFNDDKSRVTIEYYITEGTRYRITGVRYEGNQVYSEQELAADRELNPGDYFTERELNKDVARMQDMYGSLGRLYARVTPVPQFSETPGEAVLVYKINEDRPYIIRNVNVTFNGDHPHTKVTVPLNMSRIHPGDLADPKLIKRTQSRIDGSGLFERGIGQGVQIDIQRVGFDEDADLEPPPTIRGQSDDLDSGSEGNYRPDNPFVTQTDAAPRYRDDNPFVNEQVAATSTENPFAVPAREQQPAAYVPPVGRTERRTVASPVTQVAASEPLSVRPSGTTSQAPVRPSNDPFGTPSTPPVRTADAVVNPYGQAGQVVQQSAQAGDYTPGWIPSSPQGDPFSDYANGQPPGFVDLNITATEARTGRLMIGAGVNSNSGVVGNIVFSEDNFDLLRLPRGPQDIWNGTAFRGGGQRFRIEATPGDVVSRYLVSWTDPFFLDTDYSLGLSGFYFQRFYESWDEERAGGRVTIGRQLTQNLSVSGILRAENVDISDPDIPTPPILAEAVGNNMLLTAGGALTWDNRDSPLLPSEGQFAELTYTHGIEDFQYPRIDLEATQYFTVFSRPDGSGKHIVSVGGQAGWTGDDTPIFERYFAGGFQSLRGFEFRGVGPRQFGVNVGGQFLLAGTVQYMFPLLANDALHGVVFSDFGTVDEDVSLDDFRASVGTGLRVTIPAFGPVPLAFDFAFPLAKVDGDETQIFSFYVGLQR